MRGDAVERLAGGAEQGDRIGTLVGAVGRVAEQGRVCAGRRGVQGVGVTEPFLLGQQLGVLARDRLRSLDLRQRPLQVLRLGGPLRARAVSSLSSACTSRRLP